MMEKWGDNGRSGKRGNFCWDVLFEGRIKNNNNKNLHCSPKSTSWSTNLSLWAKSNNHLCSYVNLHWYTTTLTTPSRMAKDTHVVNSNSDRLKNPESQKHLLYVTSQNQTAVFRRKPTPPRVASAHQQTKQSLCSILGSLSPAWMQPASPAGSPLCSVLCLANFKTAHRISPPFPSSISSSPYSTPANSDGPHLPSFLIALSGCYHPKGVSLSPFIFLPADLTCGQAWSPVEGALVLS